MSVSATTFVNFQHNVAKEKHLSIKSDSEIRRTTLFFKVLTLSFFFFLIENFKHAKTPRSSSLVLSEKSNIRDRLNSGKTKINTKQRYSQKADIWLFAYHLKPNVRASQHLLINGTEINIMKSIMHMQNYHPLCAIIQYHGSQKGWWVVKSLYLPSGWKSSRLAFLFGQLASKKTDLKFPDGWHMSVLT